MRVMWGAPVFAAVLGASAANGEEIIVLGAAPIGFKMSTLDRDELDRIGAQVPSEALNRLAGVNIQRNNGVENLPAIRSPVLTGGQSAGSFLILEDGVAIRAPGFANVNQLWETSFDFAARVDLVRGPGGAAYGSNAVHGLVDVRTPDLSRRRFGGEAGGPMGDAPWGRRIDVSVGGFGRARAVVQQTWPHDHTPSSRTPSSRTPSSFAGRAYLGLAAETDAGWRAQSGLDRQAMLFRLDEDYGDWSMAATLAAQNLNQETAGFIEGENAFEDRNRARANPTPEAYRDTRLVRAQARFTRWLGDDWSVQVTPFARAIEADLILSFFPSRAQEITRQQGAGLQARLDNASFSFGADIDVTRGELIEFQARPTIGTFTQGLHYDYTVDMSVYGLYGEYRARVLDGLHVRAGLRAESVVYDYDNRAPSGDVGRFRRVADRGDSFDAVTPKFALSRALFDGEAYLNLARGVRPPQITDLYSLQTTQTPGAGRMETIDSVEVGWRGEVLGARLDLAAYHMDKRDSAFRNADGFTVTDARTRHQGVEATLDAQLGPDWRLAGWFAYARHTYRFSDPSTRLGESIREGDDIDTAPRRTANWRLRWSPGEDFDADLEWTHIGAYDTNAANTRRYGGHDLFALRARWRLGPGVSLSAHVRNLLDTDYADRADFAFGQDRYFPGEPRSLSIALSLREPGAFEGHGLSSKP